MLEEERYRYRELFDAAPDACFFTDLNGKIHDANRAAVALLGRPQQALRGKPLSVYIMPAHQKEVRFTLNQLSAHQWDPRRTVQVGMLSTNGNALYVELRASLVEHLGGRNEGVWWICREVSERKRAEELLRRQAALIDLSPDGIIVRQLDGSITFWSQGAATLYGWTRPEAMGQATHALLHTRFPQPLEEIIGDLKRNGHWSGELVQIAKDGREIVAQSVWQAQYDEIGGVSEIMESNVDVTERKRLLQAETQARREAEHQNELRLRFLGMISHELRTPLTSIKGFASTLLAKDVTWDAESQRDFLLTIDREADKLTDMIGQLLDLSRIESGRLSVDLNPQCVDILLDDVRPRLADMTQEHTFTSDVPEGLPAIRADRQRISQVLTNLVSNAVKYSPKGTPILLCVRAEGDFLKLSVSDQGPGIALEDRPFIFEAFVRGSNERVRQMKGSGLGLAICKGIVEAHGGRIWVESRDGPGTTVSFTLPVAG